MQTTDNSNECINWINESISKKNLLNITNMIIFIILKKLVREVLEQFIVQIGKILINV